MYCVRSVGVNYTRITYLDIYGARYAAREYKSYRSYTVHGYTA